MKRWRFTWRRIAVTMLVAVVFGVISGMMYAFADYDFFGGFEQRQRGNELWHQKATGEPIPRGRDFIIAFSIGTILFGGITASVIFRRDDKATTGSTDDSSQSVME